MIGMKGINRYEIPLRGISYLLFVLLAMSVLSTNAFAQTNVKELTVYTDSTWKVFDVKGNGWTSINFDDSYWLTPKEGGGLKEDWDKSLGLNYPEKPSTPPFYFRKTFELDGIEIMSGKIYYESPDSGAFGGMGDADIYVNDNIVKNQQDITPYLKIGKNVIAAETPGSFLHDFRLIAKIRVVSADSTSNPTPTPASTTPSPDITTSNPTPTPASTTPSPTPPDITTPEPTTPPTSEPTSGQGASTASVSLTGEKTVVTLGSEDIKLRLSAVNLITNPVMHVQVIILVPSGMSVTSSDFALSGTNQFTAKYDLEAGDNKDVEVTIRPNQAGDFNVNGRIVYYFGDNKDHPEDHPVTLPIKVEKSDPDLTPIQTAPPSPIQTAVPAPTPTKSIPVPGALITLGAIILVGLSLNAARRQNK